MPGLISIFTHITAEEQHSLTAERPEGIYGLFVIDKTRQYGLFRFLSVTQLPEIFTQKGTRPDTTHARHMFDNLDEILPRSITGPVEFIRQLAAAPWLFDERYFSHVLVEINA